MATTKVTTGGITDATIATADIADQAVTLAKLPHGTSSNDGKFLRANNGADPTFETVTSTTINNNANDRVITGSGTANTLNAESGVQINSNGRMMVNGTYGAAMFNVTGETALGLDAKRQFLGINSDNDDMNIRATYYSGGAAGAAYPDIKFTTSDSERLRITAGGGVGINATPNSNFKLDVNGAARIGNNVDGIIIENSTSNPAVNNACRIQRHGATGNLHITAGTSTARNLIFGTKTSGGEIARFTDTGLCFNGDSATANALDDYEEGTWTPAFTASAGSSATTSVNAASYTKVGNHVFIVCYIEVSSETGSDGGLWMVSGLPFTAKSNNHYFPISVGYWNSLEHSMTYLTGTVQPNETNILFRGVPSGTQDGTTNLSYSTYSQQGAGVILSATYLVP